MVKDITKRMSIFSLALIAAVAMICGVTAITANKVSADEAYSETWVIKESWTWTKDISVDINGKVSGDGCASPDAEFESHKDRDYTFGTFSVTGSGAEDCRIKLNGQEISIHSSGGNPYFGYPCKLMNMSYDGWVTASGTLTFYSDTSATEYSELRAWLEQNATRTFVQVWYNGDIAQCVSVPLGTIYEQLDKTKAPKRAGYTCIGWSNEENGEVATGALRYSDSSGALYIQVYPVYAKEAPAETAKYTVTFKDGEKVLYTLSVESGKAINLSEHTEINESAAKTGYTFKGWATTQDGAVIAKSGYLPNITADTTLYAVYEKTSGTDIPSDKPSDNPSDNSSDNPDAPADDKPSDTDKPADKPSDSAGDNITLDKSDVKKYVGITLGALGALLVIAFIVNVFGRRR